jgi:inner membrane transporter RhtA
MLYVVLGHRVANTRAANEASTDEASADAAGAAPASGSVSGIDQLGAAMLIGAIAASPVGLNAALPAFTHPIWLAWGVGVGVCSSVIPYVADQLAMARLSRSTFALMLALLPAFAAIIGAVVLGQIPALRDLAGIGLVIAGVALHRAEGPNGVKGRGGVPGSAVPPSRRAPGARRSARGTAAPR